MNFTLINTFGEIGDIHIENKDIFYIKNEKIQLYPDQEVLTLNEYWGIYFGQELINVFTNRSYNIFYDYRGNIIESFDKVNFYHIFSKDDFIYFDRNDKKTKYNSSVIYDNKIGKSIVDNDKLFFVDNIFIKSSDYKRGKLNWHFDLLSIPDNAHDGNYAKDADWEVKKFIGILEDKLWIALNHHTIIAVDIHTGSLVHQIHDIPGFKSDWLPSAIPLSEATVIDVKNNKLIGFMWEFYWEIDPQSGAVTLLDLSEDFLKEKIRNDVHHYVLTDEIIYFISHFDSKIGAFERATKRIVWHYDFVKDETGRAPRIRELQGDENQLGALSSDNTLYIFKKED